MGAKALINSVKEFPKQKQSHGNELTCVLENTYFGI